MPNINISTRDFQTDGGDVGHVNQKTKKTIALKKFGPALSLIFGFQNPISGRLNLIYHFINLISDFNANPNF
jgi:hypothetical protein